MAIQITPAQIALLAPSARSSYREAFANGQPWLDQYGISVSKLRTAHFMAQMLHESGDLQIQFENLNYSVGRLPVVWPTRFKPTGPLDPAGYAYNPQKLANEVYARASLGNTSPGDGWKYRGRGLLQLTGKAAYAEATTEMRKGDPSAPDFVASPDAVVSAEWALAIAAAEWDSKGCNAFADQDNIRKVTRAINGGLIGLAQRTDLLKKTKAVWG